MLKKERNECDTKQKAKKQYGDQPNETCEDQWNRQNGVRQDQCLNKGKVLTESGLIY
jgi:hypothetical protein